MARLRSDGWDRGFREVSLGKCQLQTATDRFGEGALNVIRSRERDHDHDVNFDELTLAQGIPTEQVNAEASEEAAETKLSMEKIVPKMQYYRSNLTALSQKYNLYFAAYQNRIFVYRPRSIPKQTLPQKPDLILATKPSKVARHVGGFQDRHFYHQMNHMITGFLGKEEILLMAYDDGSVIAYYTREIADYVEQLSHGHKKPSGPPKDFFHEDVGSSAWGLAIHGKSRLIAVSSNRAEVTVFAFGLTHQPGPSKGRRPGMDYCEKSVLKRKRNWRIILLLGPGGSNIPNISIWDDRDGSAEKVCAMDIYGVTWILDIWKVGTAPIKIPNQAAVPGLAPPRHPTGWGVMVLPYTSFLKANSSLDGLGVYKSKVTTPTQAPNGQWLDITDSLRFVRDNPSIALYPPFLRNTSLTNPPTDQDEAAMLLMEEIVAMEVENQQNAGLGVPEALPFPVQWLDGLDDFADDVVDGNIPPGVAQPFINPNLLAALFVAVADENSDDEADEDEDEEEEDQDDDEEDEEDEEDDEDEDDEDEDEDEDEDDNGDDESEDDIMIEPVSPADDAEDDDGDFELVELATHAAELTQAMTQVTPPDGILRNLPTTAKSSEAGELQFSWLDMIFTPHNGQTYVSPISVVGRLKFLRRPKDFNKNVKPQDKGVMAEFASRCCMLRTYEKDIELRNIDWNETGIICRNPTEGSVHSLQLRHAQRLSMLIHVPELSLVVVGSAMGRVVLLTLTRSRRGSDNFARNVSRGFRVDWVLPTRKQERLRPQRVLYGIAMGPVQENVPNGSVLLRQGAAAGSLSRKYRLLLHYRDHSILSYEISRDDRTESLDVL